MVVSIGYLAEEQQGEDLASFRQGIPTQMGNPNVIGVLYILDIHFKLLYIKTVFNIFRIQNIFSDIFCIKHPSCRNKISYIRSICL